MLTGVLLTMLLILADGKERNRTDTQGMLEITNESTDRFSAKEQRSDGTYNRHLRDLVEKLATKLINEKIQTKITKFDENSSIDMQTLDEQTFDGKSNVEWVFIGSDDNATNSNNTNIHRQVFGERFLKPPTERLRRQVGGNLWIEKKFEGYEHLAAVQALIVKDEQISGCHEEAPKVTDMRYFMCSGAILTQRLVITTASCLQLAIFYEDHIEANIGVLVGSMTDTHYVIKVVAYKIHPAYHYDVNLPQYSTHNLAILLLNCPIPDHLLNLPRIPTYQFNDIGHMCCPDKCDMLTIVEKSNNRHDARYLAPAFLPSPTHEFDDPILQKTYQQIPQNRTCGSTKVRRSVKRLAPIPDFSKINSIKEEAKKSSHILGTRRVSDVHEDTENNTNATDLAGGFNESTPPQCLPSDKSVCVPTQAPPVTIPSNVIDPEEPNTLAVNNDADGNRINTEILDHENQNGESKPELSEKDREAAFVLTKTLVDETMERLQDILGKANSISLKSESGAFPQLTDKLVNTILTTALTDLNISPEIDNIDNVEPSIELHGSCPPLGSAVMRDNILIGLVAYTCDDVQTWVKWTYVSIVHNIGWILEHFGYRKEPTGCRDNTMMNKVANKPSFAGMPYDRSSIIQRIQNMNRERCKTQLNDIQPERNQMKRPMTNC